LHEALAQHCGEGAASQVLAWHMEVMASDTGRAIQDVSKMRANQTLESAKQAIKKAPSLLVC